MINYWIYYKLDEYEPYAYTDKKALAVNFEKERNMKLFRKIKKELNKDEINFLAREYQTEYLEKVDIDMYDKLLKKWIKGSFIMTGIEKLTIDNFSTKLYCCDIYNFCDSNPYIFNNKIISALRILEYNNVYMSMLKVSNTKIKIKPDMLGIFCYYYGKTLRGD